MKKFKLNWPMKFLKKDGKPSIARLLKSYLDLERKFHKSTTSKNGDK